MGAAPPIQQTATSLNKAEKQLMSTLAWFRSRYALYQHLDPDRKATHEALNEFGNSWIGIFKLDWGNAFVSLLEKKVIQFEKGEFSFSATGDQVKELVEAETPFYQYEYDNFFAQAEQSKAHSGFCEQVYGIDLSQHGLTDLAELGLLTDHLRRHRYSRVLDLGCGNGRITEYLSSFSDAVFEGVDISGVAVKEARKRVGKDHPKLQFRVANLNDLSFPNGSFDLMISLDTLYYADDLPSLLNRIQTGLREGGRLLAFFSQWIMDENYSENLKGELTHLAKALRASGLSFSFQDLTASGLRHWKKKLAVLENMKQIFKAENSMLLWDYRYREAFRYAHWGDWKYSRYLYEVTVKK